ncbi:ATP-binding protein [Streptomyces sp. NBC_00564]|uniref:ATP-binding protein n=1 Tax=Streptomyces sp. NBC_00564 TaxID=2903663 RepID=UPI00352D3529|nr:ATP-binding protein [Streptomyces sp. NBC_00564]
MQGHPRAQVPVTLGTFTQLYSCAPRGARLARRLVANRMHVWGFAYDSDVSETVTLVVAELAANAVRHGRVRGRDIRVRLVLREDVVRVEVADGRADRLPVLREPSEGEGGRGLLIVVALAERWGVEPREGGTYKTVWAEISLPERLGGMAGKSLPPGS